MLGAWVDTARQAHVCVPGCTVEESFAGRPEWQLACYRVVAGRLRDVAAVHEDADVDEELLGWLTEALVSCG